MTKIKRWVTKLNETESLVNFKVGSTVGVSLQLTEDVDEELLNIKQTTESMDLITAQKKAIEKTSKKDMKDKVLFLAVVKEGEEEGEVILQTKLDETCVAAYANGVEVPLPKLAPQSLTNKTMATKEKAAKKTAAKAVTKKVEKKVAAKKTAKKAAPKAELKLGPVKEMSVKELIAAIKKGEAAYTPGGTRHLLSYLENVADKSVLRKVAFAK